MKYDENYRSDYVDDRRGASGGGGLSGGGIGLLIVLFRRFGIAGVVVGIAVLGGMQYCGGGAGVPLAGGGSDAAAKAQDPQLVGLVSSVFDDAQMIWKREFASMNKEYKMARLQLFTGSIGSACGRASASTGPFYCPGDQQVYIDLGFYQLLKDRLGAPGDFAQAYVIAHEVGHHVQHQLGALGHHDTGAEGGSVRVELQADCYAGIWAHYADRSELAKIQPGDLEEALQAAKAIGDDALQRGAGGTVRPESFSHGSSAQRMRWFTVGYESGAVAACDTFSASRL